VINTSNYTVVARDNFTTDTSLNKNIWSGFNGSASALTFSSAGAKLSSNASNNFGSVGFHGGETDSNAVYNAAAGNYSEYGLTYGDTYGLYQTTASVAVAAPGPGLLLWSANNVWPGPEIDVLEINSQGLAYATVHNMNPSTGNDQYTSYYLNIDPTKANTYAIDWEPGSVTYYVNGQQIFSTAAHVPLVPLSFGVQGGTSGGVANSITVSDYSFSKVKSLALASSDQAAAGTSSLFKNTYSGEKPGTSETTIVGTGPDNVVLLMAEDAYNGDAKFTVSVDGKQIGGTQTVTASHAAKKSDTFEFQGNFGLGAHKVSVNFLNDGWGGSASADRNLYVDHVTFNGNPSSGNLALTNSGAKSIAVTSATTYTPGSAGGTITTLGNDNVIMGTGAATVNANGPQVAVSGAAGALTFIGKAGIDTITAGSGSTTITANADTLNFTAGKGAASTASITAGTGNEVYNFINGQAGGSVTISAFAFGKDTIHLQGYSGSGIKSEIVVGGSTQITLADNTHINLLGVTDPTSHTIFS